MQRRMRIGLSALQPNGSPIQNANILDPGTNLLPVLLRHYSGDLSQMAKIMNGPGCQQLS